MIYEYIQFLSSLKFITASMKLLSMIMKRIQSFVLFFYLFIYLFIYFLLLLLLFLPALILEVIHKFMQHMHIHIYQFSLQDFPYSCKMYNEKHKAKQNATHLYNKHGKERKNA